MNLLGSTNSLCGERERECPLPNKDYDSQILLHSSHHGFSTLKEISNCSSSKSLFLFLYE